MTHASEPAMSADSVETAERSRSSACLLLLEADHSVPVRSAQVATLNVGDPCCALQAFGNVASPAQSAIVYS
jgi:hypothetical protein